MSRIVLWLVLFGVAGGAGCGGKPPLNTAPLTDEQKKAIKEQDKKTDDEEKSGSGAAKGGKKRK